jgi:CRISPR-associated exonuclease Cas4
MFGCAVTEGSIYHISSRRRTRVAMGPALRERTAAAIEEARDLLGSGRIPPPVYRARCHGCSLEPTCLPQQSGETDRFMRHMRELFMPEEEP